MRQRQASRRSQKSQKWAQEWGERIARCIGVVALLLAGCVNPGNGPGNGTPGPASPGPVGTDGAFPPPAPVSDPRLATAHEQVDPSLVAANTRFSFKLFQAVMRRSPQENVLLSPASVALALAMTYNGASGATQQAMAEALEVQGLSRDDLNRAYDLLRLTLQSPHPDMRLVIANSLWGRAGIAFKPDFIQRNQTFYGAEVNTLDFDSPEAPVRINDWVNRQTQGRIPTIVDQPIDPATILFLINAIYFKAPWTHPFDPSLTRPETFTLADGTSKQVPMMHALLTAAEYYHGDGFQAVGVPYGERAPYAPPTPGVTPTALPADQPPYLPGRVSLYVFLPDAGSSLEAFYAQLNAENWQRWKDGFERRAVQLGLPRFQYTYQAELKDALTELGMGPAFDDERAEFGDMLDSSSMRAYISAVRHKTFINLNEAGTEAAAVTSVEMGATGMPAEPVKLSIDRPFFYAIVDTVTGSVLFTGTVREP